MPPNDSSDNKSSPTKLFAWAQIAAAIGTAVDFSVTYLLNDILEWWILYSNSIGAAMGAITNFLLGRYLVFNSTKRKIKHQAFRYALVSAGSLVLNTAGVYILVDWAGFYFFWPKVIVAVIIAVTFNFILQKNYVYK